MDRPGKQSPLRRLGRKLKSLTGERVIVLLYHRIGEPGIDPHRLCVTPGHFSEQMDVLRRFGPVLSLRELTAALEANRLPRRGSVVTFDDAYADNLEVAKPILERRGLPATVFATTGNIGRSREFWWDELQRRILEPTSLSQGVRLFAERVCRTAINPDLASNGDALAGWDFDRPGTGEPVGSREWIYREIYQSLWDLSDPARQQLLDEMTGDDEPATIVRRGYRAMTDDEIRELDKGGLIEVGAHTHTHPNLAAQPADVQREEIFASMARLRDVLGHEVESFAYPYGLHTPETVRMVREAGFRRACICGGHAVRQSSEPFRLTRIDLGDVGGEEFERLLRDCASW